MEILKDKLWMTYQAGVEYHYQRPRVIREYERRIVDVRSEIDANIGKILSNFNSDHKGIFEYDDKIDRDIRNLNDKITSIIDTEMEARSKFLSGPGILNRLTDLFDGKVGEKPDSDRLTHLIKIGEKRYSEEKPPGYLDNKKEKNRYGDWFIWSELLDLVEKKKQPLVFVTDDDKDDWWWFVGSNRERLGARPELIEEVLEASGQWFLLYSPERFAQWAGDMLNVEVSDNELEDIKDKHSFSNVSSYKEMDNNKINILKSFEALYDVIFETNYAIVSGTLNFRDGSISGSTEDGVVINGYYDIYDDISQVFVGLTFVIPGGVSSFLTPKIFKYEWSYSIKFQVGSDSDNVRIVVLETPWGMLNIDIRMIF